MPDNKSLTCQSVSFDPSPMHSLHSAIAIALTAAQFSMFGALPGLSHGHHHHDHHDDHYVCAIGYHYVGHGRCVRNGSWWTGRRPVEWGPYYEPRDKSGSVSFEGPNGGEIRLRW